MRFRNGDYSDIAFEDVCPRIGIGFGIVLCIALIFLFFASVFATNKNDIVEEYNAKATEFNARPETERKIIASYLGDGEIDGENYTMVLDDTFIDKKAFMARMCSIAIVAVLVISSLVATCSYIYEKLEHYYLADLPFKEPYGWFLFFSMFVFWPVLLVSRLRMLKVRFGQRRKECKAVELAARQELKDEADARLSYKSSLSNKAKKRYVSYRIKGHQQALDHRKTELETRIKECEENLREYGMSIQATQRQIGATKAQLNELSKVSLAGEVVRAEALEEWRIISEMRGVSKITLRDNSICILVKVRVPYQEHVYDFGDYEICISAKKYSCKRVRSGVKLNATSKRPDYNESSGFCFGSRRNLIQDYVQHARMLEAITLMIDCLHSVNEDVEAEIPECFRRVEAIESVKRHLKRQQKT